MDKSQKEAYISSTITDETGMKVASHNKKRLLIAVLLAVGFLLSSSASLAMPLYMDECSGQTVCEKCCLISVPELSGLQYEYSFSACTGDASASEPESMPLPFDHPPQ